MEVKYVDFPKQFEENRAETMAAVERVFQRGDFILGQDVEAFEREFAALCNAKHAVAVGNGTDSLIMALRALGVGPGDEVITAPNSWISSASAIALAGATPVFADVQEDQNISPEAIEKAITPRTKCLFPVHLTGRCANLPAILDIGKRKGIPVVEDAAQAVTARIGEYTAGGAGIMGSFSLHPLKNLNAAGDAGVLTTQDDEMATKLRLLRHHGLKNREEVQFWGFNSRLDTLQAAVLRTRIPKARQVVEKRRANAARYNRHLKDVVQCPVEKAGEFHTYHVYVVQTDRRDELQKHLADRGVETKIHYPIPIHLQEAARYLGYRLGSMPVTERQSKRILSLPVHQYLTDQQIDWVAESIRDFVKC